jgi:carbamoyltransferase
MTAILGISAFYHDAAAALIVDGEVVAALQEERFTRKKNDDEFPVHAIRECLAEAGLRVEDLDHVGFYDKPYLKFDRLLETYLAYAPRGFASYREAMPVWLRKKLWLPREMRKGLGGDYRKPFVFTSHHEAHAAGAFFPSPFEEAAILTFDGVGEWSTATLGSGRGRRIELSHALHFPHSLGLLYSAFTTYTGFKVNSDEYKVMGLAPYGEPRFAELILEHLIDLKPDGSFRLDLSYFNYAAGLTMTSEKFHKLFGGPPREIDGPITQRDKDLAASVQCVTEEAVLRAARHLHAQTGLRNLCLSGGVALNCVANGRVLREGPFDDLWIQPAAGDAGSALGVALFIWHQLLEKERQPGRRDAQSVSLVGTGFDDAAIQTFLDTTRAVYTRIDDEVALLDRASELLAEGKVLGWFQGRMEFGPRALGARSILGDPRVPDMQPRINQKVKFREGFRPFAPAVLAERVADHFDFDPERESPHMLLVCPVTGEPRLPAITHVDGSARIQTVDERHGRFRRLLEAFDRETGCPVLVNTSFNLSWEPIVRTPAEAYETFMSSGIDALCMGSFVLTKEAQPVSVAAGSTNRVESLLTDLLASPCCGVALDPGNAQLSCSACGQAFPVEEGIPRLFWPHDSHGEGEDVTEQVKAFYEETPFPNYQDHESVRSLIDKSRRGGYAHDLHRAVGFNGSVLEVGCGTGQLSNFLGVGCRRVVGTDLCLNSLRLGETFRSEHALDRTAFVQMNLFRPAFLAEKFDVVLCNGVLHHTSDPYGGFQGLVPLVKPGGHIVIGLYNRWGRAMTDLRRMLFRLTGGRMRWVDPYLRDAHLSDDKERAWFADQYRHPHESKHTTSEVLRWFRECGIDFVRAVPSVTLDNPDSAGDGLFEPEPEGTAFERLLAEWAQVSSGNREGGFFLMIGRKPGDANTTG